MTEAINYIPNRVRNAAVGGHVCGAVDIIDDALGLEQSSINEDVAPMPYNDGNPNGMGRIILKKTDNFKNVVEAQSGNTIFVIKYDFTLTGNVTIPANCILEFNGGSIKNTSGNSYTIDFNNCAIKANYKIFDSILPLQDSELWQEIDPVWFGVIDDGVTDNVTQINYMLSFVDRLKFTGVTFRDYGNTMPTIVFHTTGPIKITESIEVTAHCHILGYPTFYYTETHTALEGAIILSAGEGGFKYEINVTSKLAVGDTAGNIDLSDNVIFGGICLRHLIGAKISFRDICGFNSGIVFEGKTDTAACLHIEGQRISYCLNDILVNIENSTWPNEVEVSGIETGGVSGNITLPSNFSRGSVFKFIGDGSYGGNSWHIHDIACEGKILNNPIDFIRIENTKSPAKFDIDSVRIEGTGGYYIWANQRVEEFGFNSNQFGNSQFGGGTYHIDDISLDLNIADSISKVFGINNSNYALDRNSLYVDTDSLYDKGLLWGASYFQPVSNVINPIHTQMKGFIAKVSPGQAIYLINNKNKGFGGTLFVINASDISSPKPSQVSFDDVFLKLDTSWYQYVYNDIYSYVNNSASSYFVGGIYNKTNSTYYVLFCTDNYDLISSKIISNQAIELVSTGIKKVGSTQDRPSLGNNDFDKGFMYFDETLSKPIWWNGSAWKDATGASV